MLIQVSGARQAAGWMLLVSALSVLHAWGQLAPLQDSECKMPPALRAVTGHALFRYRVNLDGTVGSVTELYATTEPASSKEAFTAELSDCVRRWRYKPAVSGRVPVPEQLLIAFHFFEPAPFGAPAIKMPDGKSIPLEHFALMRKERIALARRLLEGPALAEIHKKGWSVLTNVAEGDRAALVDAIERTLMMFSRVFPDAPQLPDSSELTVFLFKEKGEFNQVAAFDNLFRMKGGIAGQYSPYEQTAYASLGDKPERIAISELIHEVTHHLVSQRLFRNGRQPPYWVNEGIATFLQLLPNSPSHDLSRFARGKQAQREYRWDALGGVYLAALSREAKNGNEPDLGAFLKGSRDLGPVKVHVAYGLSWLLVHFFINGEHQKYRAQFERWLLTTADAENADSVLNAVGLTLEELRIALSKYRKQLEHAAF